MTKTRLLGRDNNKVEGGREGNVLGGGCGSNRNDIVTLINVIVMELKYVQDKLAQLRKEYKDHPEKRSIILLQVRPLQSALRIYYKNHPQQELVDNTA